MGDDLKTLVDRYRPDAALFKARDFYRRIQREGVSKVGAAALLREFYGLGLAECVALMNECDAERGPPRN